MLIKPNPFNKEGKKWILMSLLIVILMWAISLYAYFTLPDIIPTHFGLKGKPDAYGSKTSFLIVPVLLSLAPVIILVMVKFRFVLINKYPYLINLPGFFVHIEKIPEDRRSYWFNRYFELILKFNFALTIYLFVLLLMIYYSTIKEQFDPAALIFIILFPFLAIVPFFIALSKVSSEMKADANKT